jgi:hypothetical protein
LDVEPPFADQRIQRPRREQWLLGGAVAILSPKVPDIDPAFRLANIDDPESVSKLGRQVRAARLKVSYRATHR